MDPEDSSEEEPAESGDCRRPSMLGQIVAVRGGIGRAWRAVVVSVGR
jgi:hypothetical protein